MRKWWSETAEKPGIIAVALVLAGVLAAPYLPRPSPSEWCEWCDLQTEVKAVYLHLGEGEYVTRPLCRDCRSMPQVKKAEAAANPIIPKEFGGKW